MRYLQTDNTDVMYIHRQLVISAQAQLYSNQNSLAAAELEVSWLTVRSLVDKMFFRVKVKAKKVCSAYCYACSVES